MKKMICALLSFTLALTMAGCGGATSESTSPAQESSEVEEATPEETASEEAASKEGKSEESLLAADAIAKYAEEQGALAYEDPDEIMNRFNHDKHNAGAEQIDGRITLTDASLQKLFESGELNEALQLTMDYDPAMTKASYYFVDGYEDFGAWFLEALAIDFSSPEDAASYADGLKAQLDTYKENYPEDYYTHMSEDSDAGIHHVTLAVLPAKDKNISAHQSVYADGCSVLTVVMYQNMADQGIAVQTAFCEKFGIYDPAKDEEAILQQIEAELDSQVQEYTGNTLAYLKKYSTPGGGIFEDESEAIVYVDPDADEPPHVYYGLEDVYKPSVVYLYLDGVEVKQDEIDKRTWGYESELCLTEPEQYAEGKHTLEFVQYVDDDPEGEQRFYQAIEFTIAPR